MTAFVFPGQGSQKRGMGQGLFDEVREYPQWRRTWMPFLGTRCATVPEIQTTDSKRHSSPSLACTPLMRCIITRLPVRERVLLYLAGHSMGEYNALLAAGVFDFLTGLRLVKKRGELMSEAKNGGMGAVLGLSSNPSSRMQSWNNGLQTLDVANFNTPSQTVISGPVEDIRRAGPVLNWPAHECTCPCRSALPFTRDIWALQREPLPTIWRPCPLLRPGSPSLPM